MVRLKAPAKFLILFDYRNFNSNMVRLKEVYILSFVVVVW